MKKNNSDDLSFKPDFRYTHNNPYHEKLVDFSDFVLRDEEGESLKGKWNQAVFKNDNPLIIEVGTGFGHFMLEYTQNNPSINFIGIDHRFKRSFHLAKKLSKVEHKNFRYLRARGERLSFLFDENEVSKLLYFFPDPWPKTRHHKKRLFQKNFLDSAYKILSPGGEILIKTDHDEYFEWMIERINKDKRFEKTLETKDLRQEHPEHFLSSFYTKFEKIFLEKKLKIKAVGLRSLKVL